jgi:hypothetical protein
MISERLQWINHMRLINDHFMSTYGPEDRIAEMVYDTNERVEARLLAEIRVLEDTLRVDSDD